MPDFVIMDMEQTYEKYGEICVSDEQRASLLSIVW